MLMIVFGAGATHGAIPTHDGGRLTNDRPLPPLAATLFSTQYAAIAGEYPTSLPVIAQLRRALAAEGADGVEIEISRLVAKAGESTEFARHFLGLRFYVNRVVEDAADWWLRELHGYTHYVELLARVGAWHSERDEHVALVTLNYDTMLDQTLERQTADWTLAGARDFDVYINRPDWRLYKLHGSTNWCRVIDAGPSGPATRMPAAIIAQADKLDLNRAQLYPAPWSDPTPLHGSRGEPAHTVAVPAISVPLQGR
jgi:hypothetical protein